MFTSLIQTELNKILKKYELPNGNYKDIVIEELLSYFMDNNIRFDITMFSESAPDTDIVSIAYLSTFNRPHTLAFKVNYKWEE